MSICGCKEIKFRNPAELASARERETIIETPISIEVFQEPDKF
jgi:hypothetical protein